MIVEGEPRRVSMCHCLACQRRTGSVFAVQARFARECTRVSGRSREYTRTADDGEERWTFSFCPDCGATVHYSGSSTPELVAVPVGAFADPAFPPPTRSVWESRSHPWVARPADIEHHG